MNLHRVNGKPDWDSIPKSNMNAWQRLAAATNGIVTPGNFFSLLGLVSVPLGLLLIIHGHAYAAGAFILLGGRLCDLIDGWTAEATGTKSPVGEKVDATFDKLSTVVVVAAFILAGLVPWWVGTAVVLPHAVISVVALSAYRKRRQLHPSRPGKLSMAFGWISFLLFLVPQALTTHVNLAQGVLIDGLAILLAAVSTILGFMALSGYLRDYKSGTAQPK